MSKPSELTLGALCAPTPVDEFLAQHWPGKIFVTHGPLERLGALGSIPEFQDVGKLVRIRHYDNRQVWTQKSTGGIQQLSSDAETAEYCFNNKLGTAVMFGIEKSLPQLNEFLALLERSLATPMKYMGVLAFASPGDCGTKMHFDAREVFLVQIRGRKRWRFMPNEQIRYPYAEYSGGVMPLEVAMFNPTFPTEMSGPGCIETTLEPGSVAFLPRGTWHESLASEDSLSLSIVLTAKTWLDQIAQALLLRLYQEEAWREPAVGFGTKGAELKLQQFTDDFHRHAGAVSKADVLQAHGALRGDDPLRKVFYGDD